MDEVENLEKKHSQLLSTDLQLETSNQLVMQFLLLFLSSTRTSTIKGLQIMFKKANPYVLILSIMWSMKTSVSHTLNVIGLQKPFFPMVSKLVMASYAFFASSTKITANVCLFIPSLGLFDLLHHWQAEQIQFSVSMSGKLNSSNGDLLYLYNKTPIAWASIDRWEYSSGSPPNYDIYTGISFASTFLIFLILNIIQYLAIFIAKFFTSPSFRKANKVKSIVNSMETSHVPLPFEDWDMTGGTIQEHMERRKQVTKEVLTVIAVNKIIGLIMFIPLVFLGIYKHRKFLII